MITEPVPVSPHDTPKPRRSRQSARSLKSCTATDLPPGPGNSPGGLAADSPTSRPVTEPGDHAELMSFIVAWCAASKPTAPAWP
jgi:hypothetical protein